MCIRDRVGAATTAVGVGSTGTTGMIGFIDLINDGSGYTTAPVVEISAPPNYPVSGVQATAVAITTSVGKVKSIKEIRLVNPGSGYDPDNLPLVVLSGGNGVGAAVTLGVVDAGISTIVISQRGRGYTGTPTLTFSDPPAGIGNTTATGVPIIDSDGVITQIQFTNVGAGYTDNPTVTFSGISSTGIGTYIYNEVVTGQLSGTEAFVRDFKILTTVDDVNPPVELKVSLNSGSFTPGEEIVGGISSARYVCLSYSTDSVDDRYDSNAEIELEADNLLDFTEGNPFGDY